MSKYTNTGGISLALAVWLLDDQYDYNDDPRTISATTLIQPTRSVLLGIRAIQQQVEPLVDLAGLIPSRMGNAIHDSAERSWQNRQNIEEAFKALGMAKIVPRIRINPNPDTLEKDDIPIYLENRSERIINDWKVTGKYDIVINGALSDYKSTSVWTDVFGSNNDDYIKQGSIYRWLNPSVITEDIFEINYIFTDWQKSKAQQDKKYPQVKVKTKKFQLMSLEATELMITQKLRQINQYWDSTPEEMPLCTPQELWQRDPVWKYYKNPNNKTRATKNFNNQADAQKRLSNDNFVGEVVEVPGEVIRCKYCSAINMCNQARNYITNGLLKIEQ